ncbi:hypothetical protein [Candidatus Nitrosocosmicus franklandus]|uniref:Uncharacterized protein n=1 Tax=Candidatus Nitrosocosmicus franklandianus TaxID=1798806 RepID=A0A484IAV0_9ARCH|nr:hypothetical protein [Candidatus Nitrosocosmicus franklandus]VFJ14393.1 conserved protein of unknown function [Candidatus Nitrosocosmicus franklandus]
MSAINDEDEATIANQPKRSKSNNHVYFQNEIILKKKNDRFS